MDINEAAAALGRKGGSSTSKAKQIASKRNGKLGGRKMGSNTHYYAAESSMGLSYTYDSPCWMLLAFDSKSKRDEYVKAHSDKAEVVNAKTALKVAPDLRNNPPEKAWRVVCMWLQQEDR